MTVALFTPTQLDRLTANAHRAILRYVLSLARIETQLRSGAQNSSSARNQESGWTWGRTGMSWVKSRHFALVFMPFRWCWCIFMQYDFNFENWNQMKYFLSNSSPLPPFLVLTSPCTGLLLSIITLHPCPCPSLGLVGFLGYLNPGIIWSMRKLMFQKSFFFFGFWPFCALEIAFNISLLQVFPFNFLDFFSTWKKIYKFGFAVQNYGG